MVVDNFPQLPLGKIVVAIIDNRGKTPPWNENEPIELIETASIVGNNKYPDYSLVQKRVSKITFENWFRGHPLAKDILIATVGANIGNLSIMKESRGCVAQNLVCLRIDTKKADPDFIYYFLTWEPTQVKLKNLDIGAAQPSIKVPHLLNIMVSLPPLPVQRVIAEMLSALDDKIELNRRMNATLEAMARAVFRQWFVEGEDVGNWRHGRLGDVAVNIRHVVKTAEIDPGSPYIGLEHMPRGSIALTNWGNASELASSKFIFKEGEFLFGKLRPYFHKVGIAPIDGICSTDILVISPKSPDWGGFVLNNISSPELINYTAGTATGTKMPRTNWSEIANYEVAIPPVKIAKDYNEMFLPIKQKIRANIIQSRTLASLRDSLLPKLMSGEIRVGTSNRRDIYGYRE